MLPSGGKHIFCKKRTDGKEMSTQKGNEQANMSLVGHLREIRNRIALSVVALLAALCHLPTSSSRWPTPCCKWP